MLELTADSYTNISALGIVLLSIIMPLLFAEALSAFINSFKIDNNDD